MIREVRILRIVREHGVPTPDVLAACEDPSVLGVPFYVMSYIEGTIITSRIPPELDADADRRATSRVAVDELVALHSVDLADPQVAALGRPHGYLERQLARFNSLFQQMSTRELPAIDKLSAWLATHRPPDGRHALVHGDYRLGNLMYAPQGPAQIVAILDWEMATLGDPLADLGYFVATYGDSRERPSPLELTTVTREEGYMCRDELIERYVAATGADVEHLPWYQALALWKAAVFSEAIYTRWLNGERPEDSSFAPEMAHGVPQLLEIGLETAYAWRPARANHSR
jgi:aminoglycoside phosphotransferase (APT) family kinase protein